ncbi:MAG: RNA polymerase sigma factor [Bacteroidia bacterium]
MELIMAESKPSISQTVGRYGKQLFRFIRGKVPTNEDAEDISQEVWYQFSKIWDISEIESLSGWLYQVARSKITDRFRKKQPEMLSNFEYQTEEGEVNYANLMLMDSQPLPEDAFFRQLFWDELMQALEELPENQRNVFIWNEMEDMTLQEIADKTGENLKTIISRKGYAVKSLRKRLQFLYNELNQM